MAVRAVRGATALHADDESELESAVVELVREVLRRNTLSTDDLISIVFTSTADLRCQFPAAAARTLGIGDVPLLCAQELSVQGAMERVVRLLAHVNTDQPRQQIQHVYLRGAELLRQDLAQ